MRLDAIQESANATVAETCCVVSEQSAKLIIVGVFEVTEVAVVVEMEKLCQEAENAASAFFMENSVACVAD